MHFSFSWLEVFNILPEENKTKQQAPGCFIKLKILSILDLEFVDMQ